MHQNELSSLFEQLIATTDSRPQAAMVLRERIEASGTVAAEYCRHILQHEAQNLLRTRECLRILSSFQLPQDTPLVGSFLGVTDLRIRTTAIIALLGRYDVSEKAWSVKIQEAARREKDLSAKVLLAKLIGKTKDQAAAPVLEALLSTTMRDERKTVTMYGALDHACAQSLRALGH